MPETEDFHIGEIIKQSLQRQQRSAAWLARQLCTDVSNGPKILKQQHLHAELLLKISQVLNEDFFCLLLQSLSEKRVICVEIFSI